MLSLLSSSLILDGQMQLSYLLAVSSLPSSSEPSSPGGKFLNSPRASFLLDRSRVLPRHWFSYSSRHFSLISASKDACVASDSHFFQVALGDTGPVCSSSAGSCRRDHLPVPSSAGADSFSLMVFLGNVFRIHLVLVLVLLYTFICLQHSCTVSFSIHRVSRHETL